jgi:serine/threonine-protein kinase RsbT
VDNDIEVLTALLARHISPVNARSLVMQAIRENGLPTDRGGVRDWRKCRSTIQRGVELFVAPTRRREVLAAVNAFCGPDLPRIEGGPITIETEHDIALVRAEARRLCEREGANGFTMQKVTTIISELARNIVLYAGKGTIEMSLAPGPPKKLTIRAEDRGPGIPNLERIMAGQYQSKTGLGRGLSGSKRLADRFDVSTGSAGTSIVAEVTL